MKINTSDIKVLLSGRLLCVLLLLLAGLSAYADITVKGCVVDSASMERVPYATVQAIGTEWAIQSDDKGNFKFKVPKAPDSLRVSALGFSPVIISFTDFNSSGHKIKLPSTGLRLNEIIVRPKKEKYSKKNNPAVDFASRIRNAGPLGDPKRNPYYNYDEYERITIGLNKISPESEKNLILKKFDFLRSHIDTSEVSGEPILTLSTREKTSSYHFRKSPSGEKRIVEGINQQGVDDFLDAANMQTLYEDFFKNIDLYNNDIDLLHNRLVSPLSRIAPDFYKFYLTDTVMIDSVKCIELSFVPHTSESFGFTGKLYVDAADSTMFIKKVVMNVPKDINLNFIEGMYINQEYQKAPDGSRMPVRDDLVAEISIMPGTQGLYFRRSTKYDNVNFEKPSDENIFNGPGKDIIPNEVYTRDSVYWAQARTIPLSKGESSVSDISKELRQNKLYKFTEGFLKIMVQGYVRTASKSKFDIGPVNTLVSHNTLEGYRFRIGGMTTANLSKHWFFRGYGAYGTRDHKWKYNAEAEYSFNEKRYHSREFPIHSIRLRHTYDVNMLGQQYAFTNPDNVFLSFKRHDDNQIDYLRTTALTYTLELLNNFSLIAEFRSQRQEAAGYMTFIKGNGQAFGHYNESGLFVQLRWSPGEKIYQKASERIRINEDAPAIMLSHTFMPKGFMGNMYTINKTEFSVMKRFWFSAWGYLDGIIKAGHLWSKVSYPDLLIPNANLSYTIQPESFALLNPMEFVTDSYASWDLTYWANGAILNYIPLIKKLKLREVFSFRGVWGHLSKGNDPNYNPDLFRFPAISNTRGLSHTPYMEVGVGLDNIFRILRLDYVWRLSYRNGPGIDKSGLRLALHFTF